MRYRIVPLITVVAALSAAQASAQEPEFRTRGGLVSEEVAREKLERYGVTGVESVRQGAGVYEIQATHDGRPVRLQLNERTGVLRETGQLLPLLPARAVLPFVLKIDTDEAARLDQLLRFEVRPQLDRTLPLQHNHQESQAPR